MVADTAALTSTLIAELTREFPWATRDDIEQVARQTADEFADARVLAFLPILAQREARRAIRRVVRAPAHGADVMTQAPRLRTPTG